MTFQTITQIAGLNRMGQPGLDTVRVARAAMGMLIAGFGLVGAAARRRRSGAARAIAA